jgi:hypothetical protein
MGQLQVYLRNLIKGNFSLILTETGNSSEYTSIGNSIDLIEQNGNHATLFFTSTNTQNGTDYTMINTIELIRFSSTVKTLVTINSFRDTSNDGLSTPLGSG